MSKKSNEKIHEALVNLLNFTTETGNQYVTFEVAKQLFAVKINYIQEVTAVSKMMSMPNTPDYMLGVINLRGSVVPVMDISKRFGGDFLKSEKKIVIVLGVFDKQVGFLVEKVNEVKTINNEDIKEPPTSNDSLGEEYIESIGQVGETLMLILNLEKIFEKEFTAEEATSI